MNSQHDPLYEEPNDQPEIKSGVDLSWEWYSIGALVITVLALGFYFRFIYESDPQSLEKQEYSEDLPTRDEHATAPKPEVTPIYHLESLNESSMLWVTADEEVPATDQNWQEIDENIADATASSFDRNEFQSFSSSKAPKQTQNFNACSWSAPRIITTRQEARTTAAALSNLGFLPGGHYDCTGPDWSPLLDAMDDFRYRMNNSDGDWSEVARILEVQYHTANGCVNIIEPNDMPQVVQTNTSPREQFTVPADDIFGEDPIAYDVPTKSATQKSDEFQTKGSPMNDGMPDNDSSYESLRKTGKPRNSVPSHIDIEYGSGEAEVEAAKIEMPGIEDWNPTPNPARKDMTLEQYKSALESHKALADELRSIIDGYEKDSLIIKNLKHELELARFNIEQLERYSTNLTDDNSHLIQVVEFLQEELDGRNSTIDALLGKSGAQESNSSQLRLVFSPDNVHKAFSETKITGFASGHNGNQLGVFGSQTIVGSISPNWYVGTRFGVDRQPFARQLGGPAGNLYILPFIGVTARKYFDAMNGYVGVEVNVGYNDSRGRVVPGFQLNSEMAFPEFSSTKWSYSALYRPDQYWEIGASGYIPVGNSAFRVGLTGLLHQTIIADEHGYTEKPCGLVGITMELPVEISEGRISMFTRTLVDPKTLGDQPSWMAEAGLNLQFSAEKFMPESSFVDPNNPRKYW